MRPSAPRSGSAGRWLWGAVVIVAGAVALAKGVAVWERATAPPAASASAGVAPSSGGWAGVPIERVGLGERVAGDNPAEADDRRFGPAVDPPTWRRVDLRCRKRGGGEADVSLLRPAWWVEREGAAAGATVRIAVPECGIDGDAQVLAVGPCPAVRAGPGSVVTGTFRHRRAAVVGVHVDGLDGPIGATPNHQFWSDTRQAFVRADALTPGELLRADGATRTVLRVEPADAPADVFNLEAYPRHVYHVSQARVLVHNADTDAVPTPPPSDGTYLYHGTSTMETITTAGISKATAIRVAGGRDFVDPDGFSLTKDPKVAQQYAEFRAKIYGGDAIVIAIPAAKITDRGITLVSGVGKTDMGEVKISWDDTKKIKPGDFVRTCP